jgi:hypothetical protein
MKIPIRCCCDTRLLGHVELPFSLADGCTAVIIGGLRFDYATYHCNGEVRGPALKSRDYPEHKLRRIPGFEPATFAERVADAEAHL